MAKLDFPDASYSPWVAPNNVIYTYIGTSPNGYWEANTANAATNLTAVFVERTGSTMTGALKLDNAGTVALPDISFDGDVNSGLYSPGADSLALVTGGSARLNIDSTGSVVVSGTLTSAGNITASDIIINSAGTAAAPSYRFGLGTGFFSSTGTGNVSISTNSTERFTIDSSGKIGIGTTAPANVLHIKNDSPTIRLESSASGYVGRNTIGQYQSGLYIDCDNDSAIANSFTAFSVDGSEAMRIDSSGNVIVGTSSTVNPTLRILGTSAHNSFIQFADGDSNNVGQFQYNHPSNALITHVNGAERMRIDSSGNVGIGTSSPATKFVVSNGGAEGLELGHTSGTNEVSSYNRNTSARAPVDIIAQTFKVLTGNPSLNNGLFQDSSGNVGIGTSSPADKLHISNGAFAGVIVQTGRTASGLGIGSLLFRDGSANNAAELLAEVGGSLVAKTAGTERMRIDSSGNVAIGTTSPGWTGADELTLATSGSTGMTIRAGGSVYNSAIYFADGTTTTQNYQGIIQYKHLHDSLQFYTNYAGNSSRRMEIDSSGNVFIGGTSDATAEIALKADGHAFFSADILSAYVDDWVLGTHPPVDFTGVSIRPNGAVFVARSSATTHVFRAYNTANNGSGAIVGVTSEIYGNGNAIFAGSLSKGSGSFRISHPLPSKAETHHLVHSFIEGPQADLIYRGYVDLVDGQATVNIDTAARMTEGTFEVLCTNVSCFTSNESDWAAVKGSVTGNVLTITAQDATATSKVSWMVVGERKDQHMFDTEWTDDTGRVITEPEKVVEGAEE